VAAITRNVSRVHVSTQFYLDPERPGARRLGLLGPSALTCENLFTVGQNLILDRIGRLPKDEMQQVDKCLKAALDVR
jgi:mRNA-degrading endonuclease toxin of MazEF toxin-antitoxin module